MAVFHTSICNSLKLHNDAYKGDKKLPVNVFCLDLVFCAAFMKLLDNYEMATGTAERVTPEEVTENNQFLDAILETEVMKVSPGMPLSSLNPIFLSNLMHGCL